MKSTLFFLIGIALIFHVSCSASHPVDSEIELPEYHYPDWVQTIESNSFSRLPTSIETLMTRIVIHDCMTR